MYRLNSLISLIITGLLFFNQSVYSQCSEQIRITTDRDIYISGETVWYKVNCLIRESNQPSLLSRVVYMELLSLKNVPIAQFKLLLTDGQNDSRFLLPDTLSTGNYIITGYTNWMKNFGSEVIARKSVSVINPFQKGKFENIDQIYSAGEPVNYDNTVIPLKISSVNNEYKTRSLVEIGIQKMTDLKDISVSVVKQILVNKINSAPEGSNYSNPKKENSMISAKGDRSGFLPEMDGAIISGTIKNRKDNSPVKGKVLALNFVSKVPFLDLSRTDSSGRFRFVVNKTGEQDMVIQPLSRDTTDLDFSYEITPSFLTIRDRDSVVLKHSLLNDEFITEINQCIVNMQVEALYKSYSPQRIDPLPAKVNYSFYGDPENTITLAKFIELPTMAEVFKEIVPNVSVKDRKNNSSIKVIEPVGNSVKNSFILVDGVYIKDINQVMRLNPEEIKQIEVINLNYYFKDQELGAIISIQTQRGDLSSLDFDNRIFRQDFFGYEQSYSFSGPDYSDDSKYASPKADFRNLLYWKPDLDTDQNGRGTLKFYTSDDTGKYIIVLEGLNSKGESERVEVPFSVKK
jgi:hypothetical protein